MTDTGYIFDIKKYSVNDGPGIRTTVFFKGCPLTCLWCHNPESQLLKPQNAAINDRWTIYSYSCSRDTIGMQITAGDVIREIEKDFPFYKESGGGVTFSGGEPMMQYEFLLELLIRCKEKNINTVIDTSGYAPYTHFKAVYDHTDLFLFDLKIINEDLHLKYTGKSNESIIQNLKNLTEAGDKVIVRIPVVPGYTDSEENLNELVQLISSLRNLREINILPFHNAAEGKYTKINKEYKLTGIKSPSEEMMQSIKLKLERTGIPVIIGG